MDSNTPKANASPRALAMWRRAFDIMKAGDALLALDHDGRAYVLALAAAAAEEAKTAEPQTKADEIRRRRRALRWLRHNYYPPARHPSVSKAAEAMADDAAKIDPSGDAPRREPMATLFVVIKQAGGKFPSLRTIRDDLREI